jgi:2-methylaconitate cis-trans-isomerase PrpF
MGSPDPYGRQLNGMGSGISSTSKVVVLSPPMAHRLGVDVEYTFVQVGIKDGRLDMAGNCGNMTSAVGPVSFDEGLVDCPNITEVEGENGEKVTMATVRMFNTNTSKLVVSRFKVTGDPPRYCPEGDYAMDGVPGTNSRITLSFLDPAGAKTGKALPTGNPIDSLQLPDGTTIDASLVDVSNPGVFIRVSDLGLPSVNSLGPADVESNLPLKSRLESIRQAGALLMGLDPRIESVPKIVLLYPEGGSPDVDIRCLALSMGQAHKAVPLTLALCLGAAAQICGTIPASITSGQDKDLIVIGHPSGTVEIGTTRDDGRIVSADLYRTARVMMRGQVYV